MHGVGLAIWFGGNLMGAIGLNKAASAARDATEHTRLSSIGWAAWWPVQGAAMAAHLIGSVTVAAIGTSVASGALGARVGAKAPVPAEASTEPGPTTPPDVAAAQRGLKPLQWVNPALTGTLIVLAAQQAEQQRTSSLVKGAWGARLTSVKAAVPRR